MFLIHLCLKYVFNFLYILSDLVASELVKYYSYRKNSERIILLSLPKQLELWK